MTTLKEIQALSQEDKEKLAASMKKPIKCGGLDYTIIDGVKTPMYHIAGCMVPPEILKQGADVVDEYLKTAKRWDMPKRRLRDKK